MSNVEVSVESENEVQVVLSLKVKEEEIGKLCGSKLAQIAKTAEIKGFRPGKAPISLIEKTYGDEVRRKAISEIIGESFGATVKERQMDLYCDPEIVFDDSDKEILNVKIDCALFPKFELTNYQGISVTVERQAVTEKVMQEAIKEFLTNHATTRDLSFRNVAVKGDLVGIEIRFKGIERAEPMDFLLDEKHVNDHLLAIVEGMELHSEKDFSEDDLSQLGVRFKEAEKIKLMYIKEMVLPELTDTFVEGLEIKDIKTVLELRSKLRELVEKRVQSDAEVNAKEMVLTALRERHSFKVPQAMVDHELRFMLVYVFGIDPQSVNQLELSPIRKNLGAHAETRVRDKLIVDKLVKELKPEINSEDLMSYLSRLIMEDKLTVQEAEKVSKDSEKMKQIGLEIVRTKALNKLLELNEVIYQDVEQLQILKEVAPNEDAPQSAPIETK